MDNYTKTQQTSELRKNVTAELFEKAYLKFIEQADNNAITGKSEGKKTPYGFSEKNRFDGADFLQQFGHGAASKAPHMNWWVVSIYYIVETGEIILGIEENRYPALSSIKIKPLMFKRIGNKNEDVAVFYEATKETVNYAELHECFLNVCEEVIRLGLHGEKADSNDWYPSLSEYDPKISKEQWLDFFNNSGMFNDKYKYVMAAAYSISENITCDILAEKFGGTAAHYAMSINHIAEKVQSYTKCEKFNDDEHKWHRFIMFFCKPTEIENRRSYVWKMRKPLKEALREYGIEKHIKKTGGENAMKNIILYGPPGTGKTYNTVCYAVAICEGKNPEEVIAEAKEDYSAVKARYDKLKNDGRIEFTTFHQSYGYEEFIEGIRPVMSEFEESKTVEYEITDGIFKDFCDKNGTNLNSRKAFETAWNNMLDNADSVNAEYTFTRRTGTKINAVYTNNKFRVEWNSGAHNDLTKASIFNQWSDTNAIRELLTGGSRWLFDARLAIIDEMKKYGLPEYDEKETLPCVFIIDEINRGNISKIFGELITLIEPSKRLGQPEELRSILPYSKKPFGVPDNVYIIGTMNTADRSIAAIDTALRRRFSFKEMSPDAKILSGIEIDDINIQSMLEGMNDKISVLFDREHTIGHAYFMPLKDNPTIDMLANIFKNNIIPLLQEYFYEDYEKIRLVLGDNKKQDETLQFIKAINNDYSTLFGGDIDFDVSYRYEINESAFQMPEAYKSI